MAKMKKNVSQKEGSLSLEEVCLICFNNFKEKRICRPLSVSRKVFDCCCKYLHSAIVNENLKSQWNPKANEQIALCNKCFDTALKQTEVSEKIENFHREISDIILAFSLSILHRRINGKNDGEIRDPLSASTSSIEVDISGISVPNVHRINKELSPEDIKEEVQYNDNEYLLENDLFHNQSEEVNDSNINTSPNSELLLKTSQTKLGDCYKRVAVKIQKLDTQFNSDGENILTEDLMDDSLTQKGMAKNNSIINTNAENITFIDNDFDAPHLETVSSSDASVSTSALTQLEQENDELFTTTNAPEPEKSVKKKLGIHECVECFKTFDNRFKLSGHMRVHYVEKSNKCSKCPETFVAAADLKRHVQLMHTQEKRFKDQHSEMESEIQQLESHSCEDEEYYETLLPSEVQSRPSTREKHGNHLPELNEDKKKFSRCKLKGCRKTTRFFCIQCRVHLCLTERNCFKKFHLNI